MHKIEATNLAGMDWSRPEKSRFIAPVLIVYGRMGFWRPCNFRLRNRVLGSLILIGKTWVLLLWDRPHVKWRIHNLGLPMRYHNGLMGVLSCLMKWILPMICHIIKGDHIWGIGGHSWWDGLASLNGGVVVGLVLGRRDRWHTHVSGSRVHWRKKSVHWSWRFLRIWKTKMVKLSENILVNCTRYSLKIASIFVFVSSGNKLGLIND